MGPAASLNAEAGCCALAERLAGLLLDRPACPKLTIFDTAVGVPCLHAPEQQAFIPILHARSNLQHAGTLPLRQVRPLYTHHCCLPRQGWLSLLTMSAIEE